MQACLLPFVDGNFRGLPVTMTCTAICRAVRSGREPGQQNSACYRQLRLLQCLQEVIVLQQKSEQRVDQQTYLGRPGLHVLGVTTVTKLALLYPVSPVRKTY